jgi:hypothetical protein
MRLYSALKFSSPKFGRNLLRRLAIGKSTAPRNARFELKILRPSSTSLELLLERIFEEETLPSRVAKSSPAGILITGPDNVS